jgi:NAD(P)-dependent dehydrogenase (short-subunit alcohol dehydrogenase family)
MAVSGKNVVVTGSGRGWGRATALSFAQPGNRVFLNYVKNDEMGESAAEEVRARGAEAFLVKADVGTEEGVEAIFQQVRKECDRLDVLVHNAFHLTSGRPMDVSFEQLDWCIQVGPMAYLRCVRNAVPMMTEGGRIVCTGSVATRRTFSIGGTGYFPMAVAKGAEEVMTRWLAVDLGSQSINVNMVIAGWIDTEYTLGKMTPEFRAATSRKTPLGRWATSEEMANAVHFLCSPEASWITGQIITADGGLSIV